MLDAGTETATSAARSGGPAVRHDEHMDVLVVGDRGDDHPGFVGERLIARGAVLHALDRDALAEPERVDPGDLLYLLGSFRSARDPVHRAVVDAETRLVRHAVASQVPVLGICYGAQLLALSLGGEVRRSPHPEVAWGQVDSNDPVLCPPGPWLLFHEDTFTPPPGARVLGSTAGGCQALAFERDGTRALGWQFHPETTPEELGRWLVSSRQFVLDHGGDPDALTEQALVRAEVSRAAAYDLTDAALRWLGLDG